MAWYDWLPGMNSVSIVSGLSGHGWSGSQSLKDAYKWSQQRPDHPQIPESPYLGMQGGYNDLIGQLNQQASGQGPSLAQNAYREAHDQGLNDLMSAGHGGSAGAARAAQLGMGNMNAGLAAGYSNARLQEQLAARNQLMQALSGANQAWFQPQGANLAATMGTPTNGQQLLGTLQQLSAIGGKIAGAGGMG